MWGEFISVLDDESKLRNRLRLLPFRPFFSSRYVREEGGKKLLRRGREGEGEGDLSSLSKVASHYSYSNLGERRSFSPVCNLRKWRGGDFFLILSHASDALTNWVCFWRERKILIAFFLPKGNHVIKSVSSKKSTPRDRKEGREKKRRKGKLSK